MMKRVLLSIVVSLLLLALFNSKNSVSAQGNAYIYEDARKTNYRDRLIDYADIYTYEINPRTKDTIVYVRKINDFWYGIWGGPNFNFSFGDLRTLVDPNNTSNIFNAIIDFGSKFGAGYSIGLMAEMTSKNSDFSYGLKLAALEKKISKIASDNVDAGYYAQYYGYEPKFSSSISYFVLSPYGKYSFPFLDGLFATAGLDVSFAYKTVAELVPEFENTGEIYHKIPLTDVNADNRFGISLGIGYDFFIADFFAANNRVRITPYADFKAGTNIITANRSQWNDLALNIGLQFKISHDVVTMDTIQYDPSSELTPEYFASLKTDDGIEFAGFRHNLEVPPVFEIAYVEIPIEPEPTPDVAVLTPDRTTPEVEVNVPGKSAEPKASPAMGFRLNETRPLEGYTSSTSTALDENMKAQLDQYALYLKENPNVIIRLEGHSDSRGTLAQNQDRSEARVKAVQNYLISKGIPRGRTFANWRGSTRAKAPNTTEEGRRSNRRVEIVLERSSR